MDAAKAWQYTFSLDCISEFMNGSCAWEPVFAHSVRAADARDKHYLGVSSPRTCRFCGRGEPACTFRNESHVIPAAFGNRRLFSLEECDECNRVVGSPLEDDLAKYLSLPRAISRIPKRKGMPKIRHVNEASYIQGDREANRLYVYQPSDHEGVSSTENADGSLLLRVRTPSYRPANVARALGRMLLFGLDAQESGFDRIRWWVRGEVSWFPIPLLTLYLPGTALDGAALVVLRERRIPGRHILLVGFLYWSCLTVIPVPMDEWSIPEELSLLNFCSQLPDSMLENASPRLITDDEPVTDDVAEASFSYCERRESSGTVT